MEGWSEDELLQLASRMATVPAEPGVFLDRWPFIISGRPMARPANDASVPLREAAKPVVRLLKTPAECWAAVPAAHALALRNSSSKGVVTEEERVRVAGVVEQLTRDSYSFEEGEELSRRARAEQRKHGVEWSYSETDAVFLAEIVLKLKRLHGHLLAPGGVLVELGCGLGKVSFGAVMAHAFERVLGFEALPQLHEGAEALARRFVERCLPTLSAAERSARKELRIEVLCADFLLDDSWLMAGTCVFCDLTCFNPQLSARLYSLAAELAHGAVLVTLSRPLGGRAAEAFFLLWQETALTNWGETTAFVYERKPTNDLGAKDARSSQRDARAKPTSDVSDPDADDDENASDGDDG